MIQACCKCSQLLRIAATTLEGEDRAVAGHGWEIINGWSYCPRCASRYRQRQPKGRRQ